MLRHLDIKLVVIASLGVAAFCLVILLRAFGLNNLPDENVVYIDLAVGGIEDGGRPNRDSGGAEIAEGLEGTEPDELEAGDE